MQASCGSQNQKFLLIRLCEAAACRAPEEAEMMRMNLLKPTPLVAEALGAASTPVIVTGAGGWLGQAALEMLDSVFGPKLPGRVTAFASAARVLELRSGRRLDALAYESLPERGPHGALILHCAFRTRGHAGEPGYVQTNRAIAAAMRDFMARRGAAGLFIPSSGAVYRADRTLDSDLNANPYGVLKREDEAGFAAAAAGICPAVIMRIFNLAGPLINNLTGYALASMLIDILAGGPVRLRAARPVIRGYAHVEDVLNIALGLLLRGRTPPVFDTAGQEIEIGALAARAAALLGAPGMAIIRPDWEAGAPDRYVGEPAGFEAAAGVVEVTLRGLDQQIVDTAGYLAGVREKT
jgi:nucleoside-diphosphate-sugar epimerase